MKRFLLCLIAIGSLAISCSEGKKNSPVFSDDIRLVYSQTMENRDRMGIREWIDGYYNMTDLYARLDTSCLGDTAELQSLIAEYFPMMMSTVDSLLGPAGSIVVPDKSSELVKTTATILNGVADSYLDMTDDDWAVIMKTIYDDVIENQKFSNAARFDNVILSLLMDRLSVMNEEVLHPSYDRRMERIRQLSANETDDRVSVSLNAVGYRIVNGDTVQTDTIVVAPGK